MFGGYFSIFRLSFFNFFKFWVLFEFLCCVCSFWFGIVYFLFLSLWCFFWFWWMLVWFWRCYMCCWICFVWWWCWICSLGYCWFYLRGYFGIFLFGFLVVWKFFGIWSFRDFFNICCVLRLVVLLRGWCCFISCCSLWLVVFVWFSVLRLCLCCCRCFF